MKKKIIIAVIIIIVVSIATFFTIDTIDYEKKKNKKPVIKVETIEKLNIEFNTKVKVSELISSINGKIIEDYYIDTTKVGNNTINVKYINDDNIRVNYEFDINVIDTTPPLIWNSNVYTVYKGNQFDYSNVLCGDNYDSKPVCTVEGEYDTNKLGNYPLKFIGTDSSGNITEKEFVLRVINRPSSTGNYYPTTTNRISMKYIIDNYKTDDTKIGIDISEWQGDVDFEKLKENGIEFVIIRVGGNKETEGDNFVDSKFKRNIEEANKYGIDVGLYFFSYANSKEHAIRDAKWLLEQIEGYKVSLPIAFDWENWNYYNFYELSFYELTEMAESFIKVIEDAGYEGMLYSSKVYLENMWMDTKYPIWLAHYTDKTNYQGDYLFWQLCDNGSVDGIAGGVDVNVMYVGGHKSEDTNEK